MNARQVSVGVSLAVLVAACGDQVPPPPTTPTTTPSANPGTARIDPAAVKALRDLVLPDLDGKPQPLSQWKGRILVVNYWATWCAPCKEEMPAFSQLHQQYAAKGVQFVGISIDSVEKVKQFQISTPVAYPLLIGTMQTMQGAVGLGNAIQGLPFTVVLDRRGEVYSTKLGRFDEKILEQRLKDLLRD